MEKLVLYYAHSMLDYGSSKEKAIVNRFRKKYRVINPNGDIQWRGSMEPYFQAVISSDGVLVSDHESFIGRGVYDECKKALAKKKPIYKVSPNSIKAVLVKDVKLYDNTDWRFRYGELVLSNKEVVL